MECIVAIDQGTQSSRVFVYDANANPIASHQVGFEQINPRAGYGVSLLFTYDVLRSVSCVEIRSGVFQVV